MKKLRTVILYFLFFVPLSCTEDSTMSAIKDGMPITNAGCVPGDGDNDCDGDDDHGGGGPNSATEISATYMMAGIEIIATPLNASSPSTTYVGNNVYYYSGGSWDGSFPSGAGYSSPMGYYTAAPRVNPGKPSHTPGSPPDADGFDETDLPENPKDGEIVFIENKDGFTSKNHTF